MLHFTHPNFISGLVIGSKYMHRMEGSFIEIKDIVPCNSPCNEEPGCSREKMLYTGRPEYLNPICEICLTSQVMGDITKFYQLIKEENGS